MNKQQILYNKSGVIDFKTAVGTRVILIKSQCAAIVTISKNKRCDTTLDTDDVKLIVDWLIEQGMYKVPQFKIME
jgi:hypothetical protein